MDFMEAYSESEAQKIHKRVVLYFKKLCDIWMALGLDEESVSQRFQTISQHTDSLLEEMVKEECELMEKLTQRISGLQAQLNTINNDLDKSASCNIEGLGVLPAKSKLDDCLHQLKIEHKENLEKRTKLEIQEHALCMQLGEEPEPRPEKKALADETLCQFQKRIQSLELKKRKMLETFKSIRLDIVDLYSRLEEQPNTEFEQKVALGNFEEMSLAPSSLDLVKDIQAGLQSRLAKLEDEVEKQREYLSRLWDRLEVDSSEREQFLDNFPGHCRRTREAIAEEIERCEELKHQNIEGFIVRIRAELMELWEKCWVSKEEQEAFSDFYSQDLNDELLEIHELEVRRLQDFYDTNRQIFDLLATRAELWERMCHLEALARDPTRFSNRGGQLLKEEKERKQIQKSLPQVENELKRLIHTLEESSGEPFMLRGRRAVEALAEEWERHRQDKEREKNDRKVAQQKQLERETFGTTLQPGIKRKNGEPTPDMKRKQMRITPAKPLIKVPKKN